MTTHSQTQAQELDGRCSICKERNVSAYRMYARCQNCGQQVIAKFSRGHEAHHLQAECPACGNRHWTIQGLVDGADVIVDSEVSR